MTSRTIDENPKELGDVQVENFDADSETVSVVEVLTQLAYRKGLIAKVTGCGILAGLTLCIALPVRYTATTKIMPPQPTQSTASMMMSQLTGLGGGTLAAVAGGGLGLKNPNDIYIGLLNSRTVADAVIRKFNMQQVYHAKDMTRTRKKLENYTEILSEKSGLIAVSVTDTDRTRAAEMANTYTDELRNLTKNLAVTEASHRRLFYEDQLKQSKGALLAAALDFQQVQQQKGLIQLDAQARAMIEGQAAMRAQVAEKQVQIQSMLSFSTEQNPQVQLARKELASLQAEQARLEQHSTSPGIAGLGLGNVPSAGLEYLRAQHELQYQQAMYDILMKQYDAAKLDESKDAAIIQVVEPAIAPDLKSSPKRALLLVFSSLLGFFIGCVGALVSWWKERATSDPRAAQQLAQLRWAIFHTK